MPRELCLLRSIHEILTRILIMALLGGAFVSFLQASFGDAELRLFVVHIALDLKRSCEL